MCLLCFLCSLFPTETPELSRFLLVKEMGYGRWIREGAQQRKRGRLLGEVIEVGRGRGVVAHGARHGGETGSGMGARGDTAIAAAMTVSDMASLIYRDTHSSPGNNV